MTNREWLAGLPNEYLAALILHSENCDYCGQNFYCCDCQCEENIKKWLEEEHNE